MAGGARILLYDLEVSRSIVAGYGNKWDYKVVKMIRPQILMCYAWKWLGDKRINFRSMHDYPSEKEFVQSLRDLLDECDIAIAHNLKRFDDKMSNRFIVHQDIPPPSPYKQIDTLTVARSTFKFESNSLNDLGEYLGLGQKEKITYADLEDDFIENPTWSIINKMSKYNKQDIVLLEKIYLRLRPWIKNHPNLSVMGNAEACPKCQSTNRHYRGYQYTNTTVYRRIQCQDCRGWYRERTQDKDIQNRPEYVN